MLGQMTAMTALLGASLTVPITGIASIESQPPQSQTSQVHVVPASNQTSSVWSRRDSVSDKVRDVAITAKHAVGGGEVVSLQGQRWNGIDVWNVQLKVHGQQLDVRLSKSTGQVLGVTHSLK